MQITKQQTEFKREIRTAAAREAAWAMNAAWEMPRVEEQYIKWAVEELENV